MLPASVVHLLILTTVVHSANAASGCLWGHFHDPSVKCSKTEFCLKVPDNGCDADFQLEHRSENNQWKAVEPKSLTCVGRNLDFKEADAGVIKHTTTHRWLRCRKAERRCEDAKYFDEPTCEPKANCEKPTYDKATDILSCKDNSLTLEGISNGIFHEWQDKDGKVLCKLNPLVLEDMRCIKTFSCKNSPLTSDCGSDGPNFCTKISTKDDDTATECSGKAQIYIKNTGMAYNSQVECNKYIGKWKIKGSETTISAQDNVVCKIPRCEIPPSECDAQESHLCEKVSGLSVDNPNHAPGKAVFVYKFGGQEYKGKELTCTKISFSSYKWKFTGEENQFDGTGIFLKYEDCTPIHTVCPLCKMDSPNKYRCPAEHNFEIVKHSNLECKNGEWKYEDGTVAGTPVDCVKPIVTTTVEAITTTTTVEPIEETTVPVETEAPTTTATEEPNNVTTTETPEAPTTEEPEQSGPASASAHGSGVVIALALGIPIGLFLIICVVVGLMGKGWLPCIIMNKIKGDGGKKKKGGKSGSMSKEGQSPGVSSKSPAVGGTDREGTDTKTTERQVA